ncbi:MAG: FG-GAP repeat domain-containing protein, partial [bacterium]
MLSFLALDMCCCAVVSFAEINAEQFKHHFITEDLPLEKQWGYGCSALADFDNDGDLDFAFGERGSHMYWFENQGKSWKRHVLGAFQRQLGSTTMDVDQDGWMDVVIGKMWYRNSQNPREQRFQMYTYDSRINGEIHDIVPADIDGNGRMNIVVLGDKDGCFWYEVPEDPTKDQNWRRHTITLAVLDDEDDIHGGLFPRGVMIWMAMGMRMSCYRIAGMRIKKVGRLAAVTFSLGIGSITRNWGGSSRGSGGVPGSLCLYDGHGRPVTVRS